MRVRSEAVGSITPHRTSSRVCLMICGSECLVEPDGGSRRMPGAAGIYYINGGQGAACGSQYTLTIGASVGGGRPPNTLFLPLIRLFGHPGP